MDEFPAVENNSTLPSQHSNAAGGRNKSQNQHFENRHGLHDRSRESEIQGVLKPNSEHSPSSLSHLAVTAMYTHSHHCHKFYSSFKFAIKSTCRTSRQ